jgi:hypothetical protein
MFGHVEQCAEMSVQAIQHVRICARFPDVIAAAGESGWLMLTVYDTS